MSTYADISIYIKNNQGEFELVDKFDYQNYEVFAFVCGIRNYYDIEPIAQLRGRINKIQKEEPKDFYDWASSHDHYDCDTYYTWVTNKEIREHLAKFDQLKPAIFKAYINFNEYIKWNKDFMPDGFSRSGPLNGKTVITMAEADQLIKNGYDASTVIKGDRVYIETPLTSKMMESDLEWLFNRIKPCEDKYGEIYLEFKFN